MDTIALVLSLMLMAMNEPKYTDPDDGTICSKRNWLYMTIGGFFVGCYGMRVIASLIAGI